MKKNPMLSAVLAMQVLILGTLWFGSVGGPAPAAAQVPDAGAQRLQILDEIKGTNSRLDKLIGILESGRLQVRSAASDEGKSRDR